MDMARSLGHVDGGQEEALEALCRAAQPVCVGEETLYWWALLAVEDGEAQTEQT